MKTLKIVSNTLGSCDWTRITYGETVVYEGHGVEANDLKDIFELVRGYEEIEYEEVEDEYFR